MAGNYYVGFSAERRLGALWVCVSTCMLSEFEMCMVRAWDIGQQVSGSCWVAWQAAQKRGILGGAWRMLSGGIRDYSSENGISLTRMVVLCCSSFVVDIYEVQLHSRQPLSRCTKEFLYRRPTSSPSNVTWRRLAPAVPGPACRLTETQPTTLRAEDSLRSMRDGQVIWGPASPIAIQPPPWSITNSPMG